MQNSFYSCLVPCKFWIVVARIFWKRLVCCLIFFKIWLVSKSVAYFCCLFFIMSVYTYALGFFSNSIWRTFLSMNFTGACRAPALYWRKFVYFYMARIFKLHQSYSLYSCQRGRTKIKAALNGFKHKEVKFWLIQLWRSICLTAQACSDIPGTILTLMITIALSHFFERISLNKKH